MGASLHWPEYLAEAALLAAFMLVACVAGVLLEHPAAAAARASGGRLLASVSGAGW